mmetsp:Transcript_127014/g.353729  ORF Transcript_127014/g.353729 Transcript_127014/m.353729 type:complete len:207 (-) Transcript_127014:1644-2264(-)
MPLALAYRSMSRSARLSGAACVASCSRRSCSSMVSGASPNSPARYWNQSLRLYCAACTPRLMNGSNKRRNGCSGDLTNASTVTACNAGANSKCMALICTKSCVFAINVAITAAWANRHPERVDWSVQSRSDSASSKSLKTRPPYSIRTVTSLPCLSWKNALPPRDAYPWMGVYLSNSVRSTSRQLPLNSRCIERAESVMSKPSTSL